LKLLVSQFKVHYEATKMSATFIEARPSLQRLLDLEREYSSLEEQLDQAATIIGLPTQSWSHQNVFDYQKSLRISIQFNGRGDWALRWILEKLKVNTENGARARALPSSWKLLEWCISMVPAPMVNARCKSAALMDIVERTLCECYGGIRAGNTVPKEAEKTSKNSKKRKRKGTPAEEPVVLNTYTAQITDQEPVFAAINDLLGMIISRSKAEAEAGKPIASVHMQSIIRIESDQAARMLRLWFLGLCQHVGTPRANSGHSHGDELGASLRRLNVALEIWHVRKITSENVVMEFSTQCLLPAMQLLGVLHRYNTFPEDNSAIINKVERLLAEHILGPARQEFFGEEAELRSGFSFVHYIAPLEDILMHAHEEKPKITSYIENVPLLFDITIRCSPRDTPRKRINESPWLETVFKTLSKCIYCGFAPDNTSEHPNLEAALEALSKMLQIAIQRKVTLDSGILRMIIRVHSRVFRVDAPEGWIRKWQLIHDALELDNTILLPTKDDLFPDSIFSRLSLLWMQQARKPAEQIDHDALKNMQDICTKLMKSYAKARKLQDFMERWDNELQNYWKEQRNKEAKHTYEILDCIWELDSFRFQLHNLLEEYLDEKTIEQLVVVHKSPIKDLISSLNMQDHRKKSDAMDFEPIKTEGVENAYSHCFAAIILLDNILHSVHREETIDHLQPSLIALANDIHHLINWKDSHEYFTSQLPRLYRIESRIVDIQKHTISLTQHLQCLSDTIHKKTIYDRVLKALNGGALDQETGYEAFGLAMNVCSVYSLDDNLITTTTQMISRLVDIIFEPHEHKNHQPETNVELVRIQISARVTPLCVRKKLTKNEIRIQLTKQLIRYPDNLL
jgi:nucleolar pre-ribosomal-associated protein 2